MDNLTKDELFSIAIRLDLSDLVAFCNTSKKINNLIFLRNDVWLYKLKTEFPEYSNFEIDRTPRKRYNLLYSLRVLKDKLNLKGSLYDIYNQKELWLGNNQLTSLPKEIGNLQNLQKLYLFDNQLTSIPETIKQNPKIKIYK